MTRRFHWRPKRLRLHRTPGIRLPDTRFAMGRAGTPGHISYDTRLFVWQRDEGRCWNCGSTKNLHFDHIIPRSWGGSGLAENVELLCEACNLRKGARLFTPAAPRSSRE